MSDMYMSQSAFIPAQDVILTDEWARSSIKVLAVLLSSCMLNCLLWIHGLLFKMCEPLIRNTIKVKELVYTYAGNRASTIHTAYYSCTCFLIRTKGKR